MLLFRTLLTVIVVSVGVLGQQSQSYQDILKNAGLFMQSGTDMNNINLSNLLKMLSNVDQKQVLQLASQFLSSNESFGTNATVSSSNIPGLIGMLSKIPNANTFVSQLLTSGIPPSVLENAAKILPNLLKSNASGSNILQSIGSGSLNNVLPMILKNIPPQLLGSAQHIMALVQSGKYAEAISEITKIYNPTNTTPPSNSTNTEPGTAAPQISDKCRRHAQMMIDAIGKGETWALKMIDAMGKIESGIFAGSLKWLGSFDECKQVQASVKTAQNEMIYPFKGQYCTIGIPVGDLIAGAMGGNLGALTPLFAYLGVGFCIPDSCDKTEFLTAINQVLPKIPLPGNKHLYAVSSDCQKNDVEYDTRFIAAIVTCSFFIAVMTLATLYDVIVIQRRKKTPETHSNGVTQNGNVQDFQYKPRSDANGIHTQNGPSAEVSHTKPPQIHQLSIPVRLLLSFSVYTNGKKLLNTNQSSGSITSINGIRFLSMSWVILGHTYAFIFSSAGNMGTFGVDIMQRWTFTAISNALVSVDTFFTLSGFLLSYLILKEMKKKKGAKGINWGLFYFHRFWRLTPPYMLILFLCTATFKYWGDGPIWPQPETPDNCDKYWWTNLLYINNIVEPKKMCFGHAWYLANDMQFYVLSPMMLIPLFYNKILGLIVCGIFLLTTTITAGVISSVNNLQPSSIGGGEPGVEHGDYMNLYYFEPWCRMGPYIIGIIGGYILYKLDCKLKINKIANLCIWLGAAGVACAIVYGLYGPFKQDNPLSNDVSALYNATHRTVWGICICWVVIACATGNGGFVNTLLSWKGLIPLSRLTYCAYLIHPNIMYMYYTSVRKLMDLTDLTCIYLFFGHLVLSYMAAFVLSLAFESPMMGLEKVIFGGKAKKNPKSPPKYEESTITVIGGTNGYINRALDQIKPDATEYTLQEKL